MGTASSHGHPIGAILLIVTTQGRQNALQKSKPVDIGQ